MANVPPCEPLFLAALMMIERLRKMGGGRLRP